MVPERHGNVPAAALHHQVAGPACHHRREPAALRVRGDSEGGFGGLPRHGNHALALKRAVGLRLKGKSADAFFIQEECERSLVGEPRRRGRLGLSRCHRQYCNREAKESVAHVYRYP